MSRYAVIDTKITWGDVIMAMALSSLIRRPRVDRQTVLLTHTI